MVITISHAGYIKRQEVTSYRSQRRGGKGVINLKTTERNGSVVAALQVTEESDVMIITEQGKVIRVHANEIREAGRGTQGVRAIADSERNGTVVGALLIATIQFGLVVLGMQPFWQFLAVGLVVIIAVIVDQFGRTLE